MYEEKLFVLKTCTSLNFSRISIALLARPSHFCSFGNCVVMQEGH